MARDDWADTLEAIVASEIRRARTVAGLSQRALAAQAGVDQAMVSRIEAGRRLPRLETLVAIADALGHRLELRLVKQRDADAAPVSGR